MSSKQKWILITGANSGIGRACAEFLSTNGFNVYACARKDEDINELKKLENVVAIKLDVTDEKSIQSAVKFVQDAKTGLYALINNAGIAVVGPLMDTPIEDLKQQFEVNLFGVHRMTKAFFPFLLESKGRIVMMSSNSGFISAPFFGPYCSSKFALEGYSDALRRELLLYDVKVVIIQPGRIKTSIWDKGDRVLQTGKFKGSLFETEATKVGEHAIKKGKYESLDPKLVASLIHKTLTIESPKTRYMIVPDTIRNKLLKNLPDKTIDNVIKKELEKLKAE